MTSSDTWPRTTLVPRADWSLGEPPAPGCVPVFQTGDNGASLMWSTLDNEDCWQPYTSNGVDVHEIEWPFGTEDNAPDCAFEALGITVEYY